MVWVHKLMLLRQSFLMGSAAKVLSHETIYDPIKAHEYYLKTRDLKGRRSTKGFTDVQKQGVAYVDNQIATKKKDSLKSASDNNQAEIQKLHEAAQAHQKALSDKLAGYLAQLAINQKSDTQKLSDDTQSKIDALPPIPQGISKAQKAELSAKRKDEIAKIRGEANASRGSISDRFSSVKDGLKTSVSVDRSKVTDELKASIDTARTNYEKLKQDLIKKYEQQAQNEFAAISKLG